MLKALDKEVADATEQRKEENKDYTEALASDTAAKQLLNMAKDTGEQAAPGQVTQGYFLRLMKISHVNTWAQPANCEIGEIHFSNPQRNDRNKDLKTEMCAKSDVAILTYQGPPGLCVLVNFVMVHRFWGTHALCVCVVAAAGVLFCGK